ncbi:ABC transporter ATP-binding protein [bacterium]|nr:ABC transporter ATP-binding protein [bacterium]
MNAITVTDLWKQYKLGQLHNQHTMLREAIINAVRRRSADQAAESFYALSGVNFAVAENEIVGIIGRNGAGKSTLLKVLSRITYPTRGSIEVRGKLSSMLEVGTGFHEELTGRENIYLNGSIMGMSKKDTDRKLDQIVAFSGVEKFVDTPIKRYSSGMRLRLGFAVAAHLEPDVLLVDEVLAVGDAAFQRKCLQTMDELQRGGRTVLFVSHNMAAIESLCTRVIWIDGGKVVDDGEPREVIGRYMETFATASQGQADLEAIESRGGTGQARVTGFEILDADGDLKNIVRSGDAMTMRVHFRVHETIADLHVGVNVTNDLGALVSGINNWMAGDAITNIAPGRYAMDLDVDLFNPMPGRYHISLWLKTAGQTYDSLENCVTLDVDTSDWYGTGRGIDSRFGQVFLPARWRAPRKLPETTGA